MSIFLETAPQKQKTPKPVGHKMGAFFETVPPKTQYPKIQSRSKCRFSRPQLEASFLFWFCGTVPKNMLMFWPLGFGIFVFFEDCLEKYAQFGFRSGSEGFGIFGFFVTVSRKRLMFWLMGFGIVFWDCLEKYARF